MARLPSATTATATPRSAIDSIAGRTLGSTSFHMIRNGFAPWARAASTNSRCDQLSALARVMRARSGIDTTPMARMTMTFGSWKKPLWTLPPVTLCWPLRKAASESASRIAGIDSSTLNTPLSTLSTRPPK